MSGFDIFISHLILPLILVPSSRALWLGSRLTHLASVPAVGSSPFLWKTSPTAAATPPWGPLPAASWGQWKPVWLRHSPVCRLLVVHANKGCFCEIQAQGLEVDCWPTEGTLTLGNQGVVTQSVLEGTKMTFTWWLSRAGWIIVMEIRDGQGYLEITIVSGKL